MFQKFAGVAGAAGEQGYSARKDNSRHRFSVIRFGVVPLIGLLIAGVAIEARTSLLQSFLLARMARALTYEVRSGESREIRFPLGGPEDKRRGYGNLPAFLAALRERNFTIARQASWSPLLEQFAEARGYPVYHEKADAGLTLLDRSDRPLYSARDPRRTYKSFQDIPPLIVNVLRFIEDRALLDPNTPKRNPAVDWKRLTLASVGWVGGWIDPALRRGGGSTLATQIEKFRHYPGGLTRSVHDKLGQMVTAATRSYLDGPETADAQQRIIWTYLNSTPLGARAGYGEIIGIGGGLWAWFGIDMEEASKVLVEPGQTARKAQVFKQVLSLLLAQRRPSYYLAQDRHALERLTDKYLSLLAAAGIIDDKLRDAGLDSHLAFAPQAPAPVPMSFIARKAATSVQVSLLHLLKTSSLYDLDRLDLTVKTTFDAVTQSRVSDVLARLGNRDLAQALGLDGPNLLGPEDPSGVAYSVVLYERGADRNVLRVRADSMNQPFDLNSGSKLILGSTAKLRTLITYLHVIGQLHETYQGMSSRDLWDASEKASDPLSQWAAAYLAQAGDRGLQPMLDAAVQRRYSANPGATFFTGGGIHVFQNYEHLENSQRPTVEEAFVHSINLAFIRIMRDIRDYYIREAKIADAKEDEAQRDVRERYLSRFADEEGIAYLARFYEDLHGRSPQGMLLQLADQTNRTPKRLAVLFRSVLPRAPAAELKVFLENELAGITLSEEEIEALFDAYDPDRYSLSDRGYLAALHPLKLWLAEYLYGHPDAKLSEILTASEEERQASYEWLFKTRHAGAQENRIRIIQEQDAFAKILADWRNQGYPFNHLVPSLATAIGSSGDRPDALAELIGIILNDGVRLPAVTIEELKFASDTPYETHLGLAPVPPVRVFAPEIARVVHRMLANVVAHGTGLRLHGAFVAPDGAPLDVGGKTGTGDNRFKTFGPGHELLESRAIDRTATFVFFIGTRFYGTVTIYAGGPDAGQYSFTSALAVQLLKALAPEFRHVIEMGEPMNVQSAESRTPTDLLQHHAATGIASTGD